MGTADRRTSHLCVDGNNVGRASRRVSHDHCSDREAQRVLKYVSLRFSKGIYKDCIFTHAGLNTTLEALTRGVPPINRPPNSAIWPSFFIDVQTKSLEKSARALFGRRPAGARS
jgi:hypothetical protein